MCFAGALLTACMSAEPIPITDDVNVFSHRGYRFIGVLDQGVVRVKVPCCQTYVADDAFKALLIEAIERHFDVELVTPEFTKGWMGPWQLVAETQ